MTDDLEGNDSINTTSIQFSDTNSFSIRCGKCADIHNAQLDGKQLKPCECDCHSQYSPYIPYCPPDPCCPTIPPFYYTTTIGGTGEMINSIVSTTFNTTDGIPLDVDFWNRTASTCDCREHPKGGMTGEECYNSEKVTTHG